MSYTTICAHSTQTDIHLMELQLSILVDIKKVEDLVWAEVELLG